jgi:GT2 family glycosyltransferase
MNQDPIGVAVVAPVHNRKAITLQCLKSLFRSRTEGIDLAVVIVDDGSTDGTGEAIREQFPSVEVIEGDGNLWYTEGTNVGIRRALELDPQYILLINDDQVFDGDFLRYMLETAEKYPRSVVGPLLLLWDAPHKLFQTSPVWDTWAGGWRHWCSQTVWTVPGKPWLVDLIVGNCVLVPAKAFEETGLMDSKDFPNFGDVEFTPRLKRLGWRLIVDPRARVFCQPNAVPPSIRGMKVHKQLQTLFIDLKSGHNLRSRLYGNLASAPSKLHGLVAFGIFLVRAIIQRGRTRSSWENQPSDKPLKETYASAVVDDQAESL